MIPKIQKLYTSPLSPQAEDQSRETLDLLLEGTEFRLEHICSYSDCSPDDFWYDQEQDEWVALIAGRSTLAFEEGRLEMQSGDAILIPAHLKHRVVSTSSDATWLALHFSK